MSKFVMIITHVPDLLSAKQIAHELVEHQLAACVNIGSAMTSVYMWDNVMQGTQEIPLYIKTISSRQPDIIAKIKQLHAYEVPEVIVLPILDGLPSYLEWIEQSVVPPSV